MYKMIRSTLIAAGSATLFAACWAPGDGTSEDQSAQNSELGSSLESGLSTSCTAFAGPDTSACCTSCQGGGPNCHANGCYGGYWCKTSTCHCQQPPTTCGSGSSSSSSSSSGGGTGDAGGGGTDDGPSTRLACTSSLGSALSSSFGRMDGYLVSIVAPSSQHQCNDDPSHVHLQVQIKKAIYDVAVNTSTLYAETDAPLPGGSWSEGWHTGESLDYLRDFALHSGNFTSTSASSVAQRIEGELAKANHISIFATGYGPNGAHLVHRNGAGKDGALVINPLSSKPHLMFFSFSNQSF